MFFNSLSDLIPIIKHQNTVILVLKNGSLVNDQTFDLTDFSRHFNRAVLLEPAGSATSKSKDFYSVEQMHEVAALTVTEQLSDIFFFFDHAEGFREAAENAILKLIEEPKPRAHYIFLTTEPYTLLPTIRSRAAIYFPRPKRPLSTPPAADPKILALAKRLLVAQFEDIFTIADELMKQKDDVRREYAAAVIATTIELAYKSYFKTNNPVFARRIPNLLEAYQNIRGTGCNIRLQLVAAFAKINTC